MGESRGGGFAYLFERFPSFTQTFCFREVLEMRRQGVECPIWSIRNPSDEPRQDFPPELKELTRYLPESFEVSLQEAGFRRQARKGILELCNLWGGEGEKRRVYEALWLLPKLRKNGIAHVHAHFAGTAARTAFWLKKLGGIRYSFTAHANDIFCDEPHERLAMLIHESECVITVSNFSLNYLKSKFPKYTDKIIRVYNGIHPDRFRNEIPNFSKPLILAVGRYIEKKGFGDLIAACRKLGDKSFECLVVGQGPLEAELQAAAGGDARIQITGPKSEAEIIDLMAKAAVFALPCVDEGEGGKDNLPTVIMEAMAAAVPVISTRIAGVPEMVEDGVTGYLVEPHDTDALANRLRDVLDDSDRARKMGLAGRRLCEERFATERTTEQMRTILAQYGAFQVRDKGWFANLFGK